MLQVWSTQRLVPCDLYDGTGGRASFTDVPYIADGMFGEKMGLKMTGKVMGCIDHMMVPCDEA